MIEEVVFPVRVTLELDFLLKPCGELLLFSFLIGVGVFRNF